MFIKRCIKVLRGKGNAYIYTAIVCRLFQNIVKNMFFSHHSNIMPFLLVEPDNVFLKGVNCCRTDTIIQVGLNWSSKTCYFFHKEDILFSQQMSFLRDSPMICLSNNI